MNTKKRSVKHSVVRTPRVKTSKKPIQLVAIMFFVGVCVGFLSHVVIAAQNSMPQSIHACMRTNGTIRIVQAGEGCITQETALEWAIQGPTGPVGATGATGTGGIGGSTGSAFSLVCIDCDLSVGNVGHVFDGKDLSSSLLPGAAFNDNSLKGTNLSHANLKGGDFSGTDATHANFERANLSGASFSNTNLTNVNFLGATMSDLRSQSGNTWSNTICPDGSNSNNNGNTCDGHFSAK